MLNCRQASAARRAADRVHRAIGEDVRRLRADAGLTIADLGSLAGVDRAFIGRIEEGRDRASMDTYAKLAMALGADLTARLYPNTGPQIRDRHQARIVEALLAVLGARWKAYLEVAVRQPARGWIDLVLHSPRDRFVVAVEVESQMRRLEQLLRWHGTKMESLPSWEGWAHLGEVETRSQLLLVRSTRSTRDVGREFAQVIRAAYPAHPADALAAVTTGAAWPGAALIWVDVRGDNVRFLEKR